MKTTVLSDSTVIKRNKIRIIPVEEIVGAKIALNFSEKANLEKQKKYLKYALLRSLCYIGDEGEYNAFDRSFFQGYGSVIFSFERSNDVFYGTEYSPENYEISEYDTFLLKKLYADDFQDQFKKYMQNSFTSLYIYNFYHRATMKIISKIVIIVLGAIIFLLTFSLLHKRRFRFGLLNYLFPILVINLSLIALWIVQNYLQLDYLSFVYFKATASYFVLRVALVIASQAVLLWLVEYLLTKQSKGFVSPVT